MYSFPQIEERDLDMLFIRSFGTCPGFTDLFLKPLGWSGAVVTQVLHSVMDSQYGESDIVVLLERDSRQYALLIENKVNAEAMPEQCLRYHKRGTQGIAQGQYQEYGVFMTAPQAYLASNAEAQKYPHRLSYEAMLAFFQKENMAFECAVLSTAIFKKESGYIVHEVPAVTRFWQQFYDHAAKRSGLSMFPVSGGKGSRAAWPQFRSPLPGTALYFKSRQGVVDLEFTGKKHLADLLRERLNPIKDADMHWYASGKSISLRLQVRPVEFHGIFAEYEASGAIDLALDAVERLTSFAVQLNDSGLEL